MCRVVMWAQRLGASRSLLARSSARIKTEPRPADQANVVW
jgi:hypothetical protein